jgi:hypothetical protein
MSFQARSAILDEIGAELGAGVLAYVTGDREELYSHSHLATRTEAAALGLPVEQPPAGVEDRLPAYYGQLKADLEVLEKFDPGAMLQPQPQRPPDASGRPRAGLHRDRYHLRFVRDARSDLAAATSAACGQDTCGLRGHERALGNDRLIDFLARVRVHRRPRALALQFRPAGRRSGPTGQGERTDDGAPGPSSSRPRSRRRAGRSTSSYTDSHPVPVCRSSLPVQPAGRRGRPPLPLHFVAGAWRGMLPAPALAGV